MDWSNVRVFLANYRGKGDIYVSKIADSAFRRLLPGLSHAKIKAADFSAIKQKAIVLMRTTMIPAVEKIPGIKGGKVVYSLWEGYLKKNTPDVIRFKAFLEKYNLDLEHVHTSGHATVDKLKALSEAMAPAWVIPIHTNAPQEYKTVFSNVLELEDGQPLDLSSL
jgi:ribonuclease J